jgi:hypothetical protein
MIFVRPIVLAGIGLAAATPWILHGHASPDCNPTKELCAVSDALYLPEDPAPEHAPPMIFAPPVAGYTATATGTALLRASRVSTTRGGSWHSTDPGCVGAEGGRKTGPS